MEAHERFVIRIKRWPLSGNAINRIRAIQYNNFYVCFFASTHAQIHRPDKRVIACADVLEINEQSIEIFQHFCGRLPVFAIQTVNGNVKARVLVAFPFHHVVLRLAKKPMLGAKKRSELKKIAVVLLKDSGCILKLS